MTFKGELDFWPLDFRSDNAGLWEVGGVFEGVVCQPGDVTVGLVAFDEVAIGKAVITQNLTVFPELLDDLLRLAGHDLIGFSRHRILVPFQP